MAAKTQSGSVSARGRTTSSACVARLGAFDMELATVMDPGQTRRKKPTAV